MIVSSSLITNKNRMTSTFGFLALFGAFIIPLFLSSSSYADTHKIEGIYWATSGAPGGLNIGFTSELMDESRRNQINPLFDTFYFNPRSGTSNPVVCDFDSHASYSVPHLSYSEANWFLQFNPNNPCESVTQPFNESRARVDTDSIDNNPVFDWIDIGQVYQSDRDYFVQRLSPYWFPSNGFKLDTSYTDGSDNSSHFNLFTRLLGIPEYEEPFYRLELPIYDSSVDTDCLIMEDTDLHFHGRFLLDGDGSTNHPFVNNLSNVDSTNSDIHLAVSYFDTGLTHTGGGNFNQITYPLTYALNTDDFGAYVLDLSSDFRILSSSASSYDYVHISIYLEFRDSNDDPVYPFKSVSFNFAENLWRIDVDDLNSGTCSLGTHVTGNDKYGEDSSPSDSQSWYDKLTNLFNFNFINPFLPMYNLFTDVDDNSSCVSIPIIAGMLHFEEGEVCPWFPRSVRQVTTPVLSLFALMILVGFIYHWLGSSSGNLFSDSAEENITFTGHGVKRTKKGKD